MRKDLIFGTTASESVAAGTTSGNGNSIDNLRKYACKHILTCDAHTADITVKLQDSPDNSTWTDVPAAKMIGGSATSTLTAVNQTIQIGGFDLDRYERVVYVSGTGTISGVAVSADNMAV